MTSDPAVEAEPPAIFKSHINTMTGKAEWAVMDAVHYDLEQEIARSAFADMLHDGERNAAYSTGLKAVIAEVRARDGYAHVLDIGTGTGLLSMLAVTHGADRVTALETFAPMARTARHIVKTNAMQEMITIIGSRSTDTSPLVIEGDTPNVCVAEVFDTELIGEGALRTFKHAREHLLSKTARVVPSSARVFAMPVQSALLASYQHVDACITPSLSMTLPHSVLKCPGVHSVHDMQLSERFRHHPDGQGELVFMADAPIQVFDFDFEAATYAYANTTQHTFTSRKTGRIDAVLMWWDIDMTGKGDPLSMAPTFIDPSSTWRDHWMHAVYHLPRRPTVTAGDTVHLHASHDEHSMWFGMDAAASPMCTCRMHTTFSRTSMARFNDALTRRRLHDSTARTLNRLADNAHVVVVGECSILPIVVALLVRESARRVTVVDANAHSRAVLAEFLDANAACSAVTIVPSMSEVIEEPVSAVLMEPHYQTTHLPWHSLRALYELDEARARWPQLVANVTTARLRCLPLYLHQLYKIRAPVLEVMGYDVSEFDDVVQKCMASTDATVEGHSLCEYDTSPCSRSVVDVLKVDMTSAPVDLDKHVHLPLADPRCNALALWMEWTDEEGGMVSATSAPMSVDLEDPQSIVQWSHTALQGVLFLDEATRVDLKKTSIHLSARFEASTGLLHFVVQ